MATMCRTDFQGMEPQARANFIRDGNTIVDDGQPATVTTGRYQKPKPPPEGALPRPVFDKLLPEVRAAHVAAKGVVFDD